MELNIIAQFGQLLFKVKNVGHLAKKLGRCLSKYHQSLFCRRNCSEILLFFLKINVLKIQDLFVSAEIDFNKKVNHLNFTYVSSVALFFIKI